MNRAIFLDRDGTLIRGIPRPEFGRPLVAYGPWLVNELTFEPYLGEAMRIFKDLGYLTVMITNQPDVVYGHVSYTRWKQIFNLILAEVRPDAHYYCPHPRGGGCECRKPLPGMLLKAAKDLNINLKKSFMVGDTESDTLAGRAAGCKTILINRPHNLKNKEARDHADHLVNSLLEATAIV